MSYLREIQKIYEEGYNGLSLDTPLTNYAPPIERQTTNSYRNPMPGSPYKKDYVPGYNQITSPVGAEYEENDLGEIRKEAVLEMIQKEMEDASAIGMDYCMFVLGKLKEAIKEHQD